VTLFIATFHSPGLFSRSPFCAGRLELERELPATTPVPDFWHGSDIESLVAQQHIRPVEDFDALLGGWPDEESIDDFITALWASRKQNPAAARL